MKQIYLLALLLCICVASFANGEFYRVVQTNWRWRNNDGGEKTATWKTAQQNAPINYRASDGVVRLRIEIINNSSYSNTSNCPPGESCGPPSGPIGVHLSDSLQYSTTPADSLSWKSIGFNSLQPFVIAAVGGYLSQGDTTTAQLTESDNTYSFQPGVIMVSDTLLTQDVNAHLYTEEEWSLAGTSHLLPDTTYYFRQKGYTSPAGFFRRNDYSYTQYPTLRTISAVLPVTLTHFTISAENGTTQANWTVASGEAATTFALQRSTDGQTWARIQTIAAGRSMSYTAYDNNPPKGIILYYRLQLTGKDGTKFYSDIRQVTLPASNNLASVMPNPAHDVSTLQFAGIAGMKYGITVTDLRGKPVLQKEGTAVQGNNQVVLPVKNLAAGMYFIRLINGASVQNLKLVKAE